MNTSRPALWLGFGLLVACGTGAGDRPAARLSRVQALAPPQPVTPGHLGVQAALGTATAPTTQLSSGAARFVGADAGDNAGFSVAVAGDLNGDGFDDLLIGAPASDVGGVDAGVVYVVYGGQDVGADCTTGTADDDDDSSSEDHDSGHDHSSGGGRRGGDHSSGHRSRDHSSGDHSSGDHGSHDDHSSDHHDHHGNGNGQGGCGAGAGAFPGTVNLAQADARLIGESAGDAAGWAVAGAGDLNADGYDDILVAALGNDEGGTEAGAVYVVYGPVSGDLDLSNAQAKLVGEAAEDQAGISIAGAGDVDGDGNHDILVGARANDEGGDAAGAVYVVLGPVSGTIDLAKAPAKLLGEAKADLAGGSVSGVGDVNGDGYADFLVGAAGNDEGGNSAGAAYLVHGPVTGTQSLSGAAAKLVGEDAADSAGLTVAGGGDIDGDGVPDLLVGAAIGSNTSLDAGAAYVVLSPVSGTVDLSTADARLGGAAAGDHAEIVAPGGDANGDGYDDVLVGAWSRPYDGNTPGGVYTVHGAVTGTTGLEPAAHGVLVGAADQDRCGFSVDGRGDVNGDGYDDLIVGAFLNDEGGDNAGVAYLVLGAP